MEINIGNYGAIFKDKEFIEQKKLVFGGEGAKLELHDDKKLAILSFGPDISIIEKKLLRGLH